MEAVAVPADKAASAALVELAEPGLTRHRGAPERRLPVAMAATAVVEGSPTQLALERAVPVVTVVPVARALLASLLRMMVGTAPTGVLVEAAVSAVTAAMQVLVVVAPVPPVTVVPADPVVMAARVPSGPKAKLAMEATAVAADRVEMGGPAVTVVITVPVAALAVPAGQQVTVVLVSAGDSARVRTMAGMADSAATGESAVPVVMLAAGEGQPARVAQAVMAVTAGMAVA